MKTLTSFIFVALFSFVSMAHEMSYEGMEKHFEEYELWKKEKKAKKDFNKYLQFRESNKKAKEELPLLLPLLEAQNFTLKDIEWQGHTRVCHFESPDLTWEIEYCGASSEGGDDISWYRMFDGKITQKTDSHPLKFVAYSIMSKKHQRIYRFISEITSLDDVVVLYKSFRRRMFFVRRDKYQTGISLATPNTTVMEFIKTAAYNQSLLIEKSFQD